MGTCCYECIITAEQNPPLSSSPRSPQGSRVGAVGSEPPRCWVRPPAPARGTAAGAQAGPAKRPGCGCQQRLCRERRGTARQTGGPGVGGENASDRARREGLQGDCSGTTGLRSRNTAHLFLGRERGLKLLGEDKAGQLRLYPSLAVS